MSSEYHALPAARYRLSPLIRALGTMWRAWAIVLPAVAINSVIQAGVSALPYSPDSIFWNFTAALASALTLFITVALLAAAALAAVSGTVPRRFAIDLVFTHRLRLAGWMLIIGSAAILGFAAWTVPGIVVLATTPFVLFAVLEGHTHPLRANFATIRRHVWHWLLMASIVTILSALAVIVFGFTQFFLRGFLGASNTWLALGLGISWVSTAWALVYRRDS